MRNRMLRCPRLYWNVPPRSLSSKVDGHVAEKDEYNGSSSGAFSALSALTASYLSDTLSTEYSK